MGSEQTKDTPEKVFGALLRRNGDVFVGTRAAGKLEGWGLAFWSNRGRYWGHFSRGEREGRGVLFDGVGTTFSGNFQNNPPHGWGAEVRKPSARSGGGLFVVQYSNGVITKELSYHRFCSVTGGWSPRQTTRALDKCSSPQASREVQGADICKVDEDTDTFFRFLSAAGFPSAVAGLRDLELTARDCIDASFEDLSAKLMLPSKLTSELWLFLKAIRSYYRMKELQRVLDQMVSDLIGLDCVLCREDITLEDEIAKGGFGAVYRARYAEQTVAVKVVELTTKESYRLNAELAAKVQSMCTEVMILRRIAHNHSSIPDLIGVSIDAKSIWLTMEFVEGRTLSDLIHDKENRPFSTTENRTILAAIINTMALLHAEGVVHGDLKSSNVIVNERCGVKIVDFGLSTLQMTETENVEQYGGTAAWAAPEVLRHGSGGKPIDVYSFGVLAWELLTGRSPHTDLTELQLVGMVGWGGRKLDNMYNVCPEFQLLVRDCTEWAPSKRPSFDTLQKRIADI